VSDERRPAVSDERRPDPDTPSKLANERTYLAWLRTALALVAAGVAADRVLPAGGIILARQVVGVTFILAGVLTAAFARSQWRAVDRAVRAGRPLPRPFLGYLVAAVIVLDGLATIVLLLRADAR
jgi:putative membrane protein